jgi:hypothetical protein
MNPRVGIHVLMAMFVVAAILANLFPWQSHIMLGLVNGLLFAPVLAAYIFIMAKQYSIVSRKAFFYASLLSTSILGSLLVTTVVTFFWKTAESNSFFAVYEILADIWTTLIPIGIAAAIAVFVICHTVFVMFHFWTLPDQLPS